VPRRAFTKEGFLKMEVMIPQGGELAKSSTL
jgi:hypothetical protein